MSNSYSVLAVILSAAKDLCVRRARPFAALRVTGFISKCLQFPYCRRHDHYAGFHATRDNELLDPSR